MSVNSGETSSQFLYELEHFSEVLKNIWKVYIFSQNFSYKWILKYSENAIIFKKYFLIF